MVSIIARSIESDEFDQLMEHIRSTSAGNGARTLRFQRGGSRPGDGEDPLPVDKVEKQLAQDRLDCRAMATPSRHQFLFLLRYVVERMFPELAIGERCPRLIEWRKRCARARQWRARSRARTAPRRARAWTGEAR